MEALREDFDSARNCVPVTDGDAVRRYFSQLTSSLDGLAAVLTAPPAGACGEARAVLDLLVRLRETCRVLSLRYLQDRPGDFLRIDPTASGFFHFSTLLDLEVDYASAERELARLPPADRVRRELADAIVTRAHLPRELVGQLARRAYFESLRPERLYSDFVPGGLVRLTDSPDPTWRWSFATYDRARNRPYIYVAYLTQPSPTSPAAPRERARLDEAAHRLASAHLPLLAFARQLDAADLPVSPRVVKRWAIGPWWSPTFTELDPPLQPLLEPLSDRAPHLLEWELETLLSDREQRVPGGLLSPPRVRQVYWLPPSLTSRGASHIERSVLLPHWLAQHLTPYFNDHRIWTRSASGEVHPVTFED